MKLPEDRLGLPLLRALLKELESMRKRSLGFLINNNPAKLPSIRSRHHSKNTSTSERRQIRTVPQYQNFRLLNER